MVDWFWQDFENLSNIIEFNFWFILTGQSLVWSTQRSRKYNQRSLISDYKRKNVISGKKSGFCLGSSSSRVFSQNGFRFFDKKLGPTVSVWDEADDDEELVVVVDTPLMLSLSFAAPPSTVVVVVAWSADDDDFFPPKTFDGSSRGKTSRDGVGVIWFGKRGSSERAWDQYYKNWFCSNIVYG